MFRKTLVAALLVLLPVPARAQAAAPDFRDYQSLLDQYVFRISGKGRPFDTRFDYEQLYVDEKVWSTHRAERLERLHAQLVAATPSAMTAPERLAWGINTYNLLVVERITKHLLKPGRRYLRYRRADEIIAYNGSFYEAEAAVVQGRSYTLDGFQRAFVYGDTAGTGGARPPLADPRVLFATNSGCIGAPPILPRAFRVDSLDRQLEEAARTALALPRFVSVQANPPQLRVSDWLGRNLADFGGEAGLFAFIRKYSPRATRDDIRRAHLAGVSTYLPLDPLLNQKEHVRVIIPAAPESDEAQR